MRKLKTLLKTFMKEKESDIQKAICEYLNARGYFFWRNNTVPVFDGKFYRPMPKYSINGQPDIILIVDGKFIGLEVKTTKTKQSESQIFFEERCLRAKARYHVVRSIDDVIKLGF